MAQNSTGRALLIVLSNTGSQHDRPDQPRDAAHHMNDGGTGKINESQLCQPSLTVPYPACLNGVDHSGDNGGVNAIAGKLGALRHSAGHNGGGGGAKYKLEKEVRPIKVIEVGKELILRQSNQAEEVILAVHNAVAQQHKDYRSDAKIHQVLHDDVARVLGPGETGFHGGKPALHEEHQNRAYQIPY
jgi:hypothetical protein